MDTRADASPKSIVRSPRKALRVPLILVGIYVALTATWYYLAFAPSEPLGFHAGGDDIPGLLVNLLIGTLFLFGLQFLFLLGAPQLRWPRPRRKRSIFISLAAGSAIAMLLSLGIVLAGISLYRLLYDPQWFEITWGPVSTTQPLVPATKPTLRIAAAPPAPRQSPWNLDLPWTWIAIGAGGWAFWLLVFALIGSGEWTRRFGWVYRTLIAGTILELVITIPIDVQVRRRTQCYCDEGTFFSLIIGLTAILWTFGPGVAILFFIRRNQLRLASGRCRQCGYDLRGLSSRICPECGTGF